MPRTIRNLALFVLAVIVAIIVIPTVVRWEHNRDIHHQVSEALQEAETGRRHETLGQLRDAHLAETTEFILLSLDNNDKTVRHRAAQFLVALPQSAQLSEGLITRLHKSPDPAVRFSCAVALLPETKSPAIRDAYIQALQDPAERVVQIACMELGHEGGPKATAALFQTLSHPSWQVRLEACKALITLKAADKRVVSTLEAMQHQPEAAQYDAQIEAFDRIDKTNGVHLKGWGQLATILQQAKQIAARRHD